MLKSRVPVSGDRVTIQRYVPLGSVLNVEPERTGTLGFDSKSRHLTLYQRNAMSEELIMDEYRIGIEAT